MNGSYVLFDLDNCISNDAWRIPRINWAASDPDQRYHAYHTLSAFDQPANLAFVRIWQRAGAGIIITTSRPVTLRAMTLEWLARRCDIQPAAILMRNVGDRRTSPDLKCAHLDWLASHYDVELERIRNAYDDREDVVAMYRSVGIPAHRLKIHDKCSYTAPNAQQAVAATV